MCAASGDPERGECGGGEGVRGYDLPVSAQRGNQKEAIHSGTLYSMLHIHLHILKHRPLVRQTLVHSLLQCTSPSERPPDRLCDCARVTQQ